MYRIEKIKDHMISCLESNVDTMSIDEAGKLTDMIKDLAEAEKDCMKAAYYSTVMEAMDGAEEHTKRFGYDNWRYASGRFAPKGHGTYSGYTPHVQIHDPKLGDIRMGYPMHTSDKGRYYDDYQEAKRHYHESGSVGNFENMQTKLSENVSNILMQLREMIADADPEMQKKIKKDITTLTDELNRMA